MATGAQLCYEVQGDIAWRSRNPRAVAVCRAWRDAIKERLSAAEAALKTAVADRDVEGVARAVRAWPYALVLRAPFRDELEAMLRSLFSPRDRSRHKEQLLRVADLLGFDALPWRKDMRSPVQPMLDARGWSSANLLLHSFIGRPEVENVVSVLARWPYDRVPEGELSEIAFALVARWRLRGSEASEVARIVALLGLTERVRRATQGGEHDARFVAPGGVVPLLDAKGRVRDAEVQAWRPAHVPASELDRVLSKEWKGWIR